MEIESPNPLRPLTSAELIAHLGHNSFNKPTQSNRDNWEDSLKRAVKILQKLNLNVKVERAWNIVASVCEQVSDVIVFRHTHNEFDKTIEKGELAEALRSPQIREIRRRLRLRIAIRLRMGNHHAFSSFVEFIRNNPNYKGSIISNHAAFNPTNGKNVRSLIAGIRQDYIDEYEDENVFYELLAAFLTEQTGVVVEVEKNSHQKNILVTMGRIQTTETTEEQNGLQPKVPENTKEIIDETPIILDGTTSAQPIEDIKIPSNDGENPATQVSNNEPTQKTIYGSEIASTPTFKDVPEYDPALIHATNEAQDFYDRAKKYPFLPRGKEIAAFKLYKTLKRATLKDALSTEQGIRAAISLFIPIFAYSKEQRSGSGMEYGFQKYTSSSIEPNYIDNSILLSDTELFDKLLNKTARGHEDKSDESSYEDDGSDFDPTKKDEIKNLLILGKKILNEKTEDREAMTEEFIDLLLKIAHPNPSMVGAIHKESGISSNDNLNKLKKYHAWLQTPYLRNVGFLARRHVKVGVPLDAALAYATLGLLRSIDVYDERGGTPFWKYIWGRISGTISRYEVIEKQTIHIPAGTTDIIKRIKKYLTTNGKILADTTPEELHNQLKIPVLKIQTVLNAMRLNRLYSIDETNGDDDRTLLDRSSGAQTDTPEDEASNSPNEFVKLLKGVTQLTDRQRDILICRFVHNFTLEETAIAIAEKYPKNDDGGGDCTLSRESIRQIEKEALAKIKKHLTLKDPDLIKQFKK